MQFIQAAGYTKANRKPGDVKWLVFHDMEMTERADTAEACARYFASTTRASSHYTVDSDSVVQCVKETDIAWCAPGANSIGLHVEHAGFARQSRAEWLDDYGKAMLDLSAALFVDMGKRWGIPLVKLTVAEIKAGKPGIISHYDLTLAGIGGNTHTDPGKDFPWDYFMQRVAFFAGRDGGGTGDRDKPTRPALLVVDGQWGKDTTTRAQRVFKSGFVDGIVSRQTYWTRDHNPALLSSSWDYQPGTQSGSPLIKAIQKWCGATVDGVWGPDTCKKFQRKLGTTVDGELWKNSPAVKAFQQWLNEQKV